jgi:SAM-dependent methyltransferase
MARHTSIDPKQIVADSYDRIAETYAAFVERSRNDPRDRYTALVCDQLQSGAQVLELGCGGGLPTSARLAERFEVTGVDLSLRQVELARTQVPRATFVQGDMTNLGLPDESFDAVVAFYSVIHVPRRDHRRLFRDIASWLRPGGLLAVTMATGSSADGIEEDWLGAPMFFSHYGATTNKRLIRDAGLHIVSAQVEQTDEDGVPVPFLWVVATKPGGDEAFG